LHGRSSIVFLALEVLSVKSFVNFSLLLISLTRYQFLDLRPPKSVLRYVSQLATSSQKTAHLPRELVDRIIGMYVKDEVLCMGVQIDEHYRFPGFLQIDRYYRKLHSAWWYYDTRFFVHGPELDVLERWCAKFLETMPEDHRTGLGHLEIQHTIQQHWSLSYGGQIILVGDFYSGMKANEQQAKAVWMRLQRHFEPRCSLSGARFELPRRNVVYFGSDLNWIHKREPYQPPPSAWGWSRDGTEETRHKRRTRSGHAPCWTWWMWVCCDTGPLCLCSYKERKAADWDIHYSIVAEGFPGPRERDDVRENHS